MRFTISQSRLCCVGAEQTRARQAKMSSRTLAVTSEELQAAWEKVKGMATLPTPPDPKLPPTSSKTSMKSRLQGIQAVISALEYNYTGTLYFDVNKNRSFKSIVSTAKDMLKEVLPIQCLEAVFLGAYLSAGLPEIDRFPVSFKTMTGDTVHRHIILAVRHQHVLQTKWGALGLSRVDGLMYKELKFHSLSELVQDYSREFGKVYHSVVKVYVGFPFSHDIHSSEKVEWRMMNLPIESDNWVEVAQHLDGFSKDAQEVIEFKRAKGELPDWYSTKFPLHTPESESGKHSPDRKRHTAEGTFGFSLLVDGGNVSPPAPAKIEESPERPGPILVAPDEVVFKQALADTAQVLPTNVFLQNTTTNAFLVEIRDPSGQIEVVTKPAPTAVGNSDQGSDNNASACFRISAKGMIVVAMKYSPLSNTLETPAPVQNTNQQAVKANETRLTNSRPGAIPASAGSRGKRGRTSDMEATSKSKSTSAIPAKQVVILRCTRLLRGEDGSEDVRDGEPYIHELPYTIKSS